LIVIFGVLVSSIKYRVFKEGRAINTNKRAGRTVQIVSISCPSMTNLLNLFLFIREMTKYKVKIVIRIKIIIA
jgi:hypothetical protein